MDWVRIFTSKQEARKRLMAGKPQLLLLGNIRICLVVLEDKIYAMEDKCSHNGESLSKGTVNYLGEVVCSWHGYRFTPQTGRETGERSSDLKTYPIKEDDSGVFVWI